MRLFTALLVTTTLTLGCSSGSGGSGTPAGGSAATGGASTGGSAATGGSGAGGAAAGGTAAGGTAAGGAATGGAAAGGAGGSAMGGAGSGDTYANFAKGFFDMYCVSCHGPTTTDQARDFSTMTDITRDHAMIRCGVATKSLSGCSAYPNISPTQFPIGSGPKPTDAERTRLVAWIDAGMPQ